MGWKLTFLKMGYPLWSAPSIAKNFLTFCGYPPKKISRPKGIGLYYKDSSAVEDLLALMKTVQNRRAKLESIGKKLYAHDDRIYREARALFLSEMTLSLNIDEEAANALLLKTWPSFGMTE